MPTAPPVKGGSSPFGQGRYERISFFNCLSGAPDFEIFLLLPVISTFPFLTLNVRNGPVPIKEYLAIFSGPFILSRRKLRGPSIWPIISLGEMNGSSVYTGETLPVSAFLVNSSLEGNILSIIYNRYRLPGRCFSGHRRLCRIIVHLSRPLYSPVHLADQVLK